MRKFKERFVLAYKAVLSIKKTAKKSPEVPIFHVLSGSIILLLLLSLFTIIFNLFENLHFVLLSSNLFLVGSFLLYLLVKETVFKNINQLEYPIVLGFLYDLVWFITCLSLFNSLVYLLVLRVFVATNLIVVNGLIGIIGLAFYHGLKKLTYRDSIPIYDVMPITNWNFLIFFGVFYILGLASVSLGYLIALVIVISLFFIKRAFQNFLVMPLEKNLSLLSLIGVLGLFLSWRIWIEEDGLLDSFTERTLNRLDAQYEILGYESGTLFYQVSDMGLMVDHADYVIFLDETLAETLRIEKVGVETFYIIENTLYKMVLSDNQDDLINDQLARFDVFKYHEDQGFMFFDTVSYNPEENTYKRVMFFFLDDQIHYVLRNNTFNIFNKNGEVIERDYPRHWVIYEDEHHTIFVSNNAIRYDVGVQNNVMYHNGFIADGQCIDRLSDYIDPDATLCEVRVSMSQTATFYQHDGIFYVLDASMTFGRHLVLYNSDGQFIERVIDGDELYYYQDHFIVVNRQGSSVDDVFVNNDVLTVLDPNAPIEWIISRPTQLTQFVVIYWVGWLYLLPISLKKEAH
jgi:hypothetical protein